MDGLDWIVWLWAAWTWGTLYPGVRRARYAYPRAHIGWGLLGAGLAYLAMRLAAPRDEWAQLFCWTLLFVLVVGERIHRLLLVLTARWR